MDRDGWFCAFWGGSIGSSRLEESRLSIEVSSVYKKEGYVSNRSCEDATGGEKAD